MILSIQRKRASAPFKVIISCIVLAFLASIVASHLDRNTRKRHTTFLPSPSKLIPLSSKYNPPLLRGITIHPDNPFRFDFIIDQGDADLKPDQLKEESRKLIKHFLASLTIPESDLWVNLSPYETERIIAQELGITEMGKDLLAQDYILKQIFASVTHPDSPLGKEFWAKVYKKAYELYGTTDIPINTFNKIWIVPEKAVVYENENSAFVIESRLRVMLEEDYLALNSNLANSVIGTDKLTKTEVEMINDVSSSIMKELVLPQIEKEINEGKNFASLRQVYNSLVLAVWFKKKLRQNLINKIYSDKKKVKGVDVADKAIKEKIYNQYLEAYQVGAYNYIKTEYDQNIKQTIARRYYSGGADLTEIGGTIVSTAVLPSSGLPQNGPASGVGIVLDGSGGISGIGRGQGGLGKGRGGPQSQERVAKEVTGISAGKRSIKILFTFESKIRDEIDINERDPLTTALSQVYLKLFREGKMSLSDLEDKLNGHTFFTREAATLVLGQVYAELVQEGKMSLSDLESKHAHAKLEKGGVVMGWWATATALSQVYLNLFREGKMSLSDLEDKVKSGADYLREIVAPVLSQAWVELFRQGKMSLSDLYDKLDSKDMTMLYVVEAAALALGQVWAELVREGSYPDLSILEGKLIYKYWHNSDNKVQDAIQIAHTQVYAELVQEGKMSLSDLEDKPESLKHKFNDNPNYLREIVAPVLSQAWVELFRQGKMSLSDLEDKLNSDNFLNRAAAATSLGQVWAESAQKGDMSLSDLESRYAHAKLGSVYGDVYILEVVIKALSQVYLKLFREGKMSLSDLEDKLNSDNFLNRAAAATSLGQVLKEIDVSQEDYERYQLWREDNLPFYSDLIDKYMSSDNPRQFIASLKKRAKEIIDKGFDYNDQEKCALAFIGLGMSGVNMSWKDFKERMDALAKFDRKNPGHFMSLFRKTKGLRSVELSDEGSKELDTGNVDRDVLKDNAKKLHEIKRRIDSLSWLDEDFSGDKKFNLRNLYYQLQKQKAQKTGQLRQGERFRVDIPSDEAMRVEIESSKRDFYRIAFQFAHSRLSSGRDQDKYLRLMRDLIVSEALEDQALASQLQSSDSESQIYAFKTLYEDYKNHLPDSAGLRTDKIKGLREHFEQLSRDVYKQLDKIVSVKSKGKGFYRLVPVGFLGVFRGRANIVDCSFDVSKGFPFTRAMHEDTIYYFVYKGKELKGYIGLQIAKDEDSNKILAIDTIQSPSLDGEKLLNNLFKVLSSIASQLGCSGIALPVNLDATLQRSFNFDNRKTISAMGIYKRAKKINLSLFHQESWRKFTSMFGKDTYNSIEYGEFRLLSIDFPADLTSTAVSPSSGVSQNGPASGVGIDQGGLGKGRGASQARKQLERIDEREWVKIISDAGLTGENIEHTQRNVRAAEHFAKREGLSERETEMLKVALWLHDISKERVLHHYIPESQGLSGALRFLVHHLEGAEQAELILKQLGYDRGFIEAVKNIIIRHMGPIEGASFPYKGEDLGFTESMRRKILEGTDIEKQLKASSINEDRKKKLLSYIKQLKKGFPEPRTKLEKVARDIDLLDLAANGTVKVVSMHQTDSQYYENDRPEEVRYSFDSAMGSAWDVGLNLYTDTARAQWQALMARLREFNEDMGKRGEFESIERELSVENSKSLDPEERKELATARAQKFKSLYEDYVAKNSVSYDLVLAGFSIDDVTEADIAAIRQLASHVSGRNMTEENILRYIEESRSEKGIKRYLKVCRKDGKTIGYIFAIDEGKLFGKKTLHIAQIVVSPEHRRQGIARSLFKSVFDQAIEDGYERFSALPTHEASERILTAYGFKKLGGRYDLDLSSHEEEDSSTASLGNISGQASARVSHELQAPGAGPGGTSKIDMTNSKVRKAEQALFQGNLQQALQLLSEAIEEYRSIMEDSRSSPEGTLGYQMGQAAEGNLEAAQRLLSEVGGIGSGSVAGKETVRSEAELTITERVSKIMAEIPDDIKSFVMEPFFSQELSPLEMVLHMQIALVLIGAKPAYFADRYDEIPKPSEKRIDKLCGDYGITIAHTGKGAIIYREEAVQQIIDADPQSYYGLLTAHRAKTPENVLKAAVKAGVMGELIGFGSQRSLDNSLGLLAVKVGRINVVSFRAKESEAERLGQFYKAALEKITEGRAGVSYTHTLSLQGKLQHAAASGRYTVRQTEQGVVLDIGEMIDQGEFSEKEQDELAGQFVSIMYTAHSMDRESVISAKELERQKRVHRSMFTPRRVQAILLAFLDPNQARITAFLAATSGANMREGQKVSTLERLGRGLGSVKSCGEVLLDAYFSKLDSLGIDQSAWQTGGGEGSQVHKFYDRYLEDRHTPNQLLEEDGRPSKRRYAVSVNEMVRNISAKRKITPPSVGSSYEHVNEAILEAYTELDSERITPQQAAQVIVDALSAMSDPEYLVNIQTAIDILRSAKDPRFDPILRVLEKYSKKTNHRPLKEEIKHSLPTDAAGRKSVQATNEVTSGGTSSIPLGFTKSDRVLRTTEKGLQISIDIRDEPPRNTYPRLSFYAKSDEHPVGYAIALDVGNNMYILEGIEVGDTYQRKGIATELILTASEEITRRGAKLYLDNNFSEDGAQLASSLEGQGFVTRETVEGEVFKGKSWYRVLPKGGIDLNPQNLTIQTIGSMNVSNYNIPFDIQTFEGFTFHIINIKEIDDLDEVLKPQEPQGKELSFLYK